MAVNVVTPRRQPERQPPDHRNDDQNWSRQTEHDHQPEHRQRPERQTRKRCNELPNLRPARGLGAGESVVKIRILQIRRTCSERLIGHRQIKVMGKPIEENQLTLTDRRGEHTTHGKGEREQNQRNNKFAELYVVEHATAGHPQHEQLENRERRPEKPTRDECPPDPWSRRVREAGGRPEPPRRSEGLGLRRHRLLRPRHALDRSSAVFKPVWASRLTTRRPDASTRCVDPRFRLRRSGRHP